MIASPKLRAKMGGQCSKPSLRLMHQPAAGVRLNCHSIVTCKSRMICGGNHSRSVISCLRQSSGRAPGSMKETNTHPSPDEWQMRLFKAGESSPLKRCLDCHSEFCGHESD